MRVVNVILEYGPIHGGAQRQVAAIAPRLIGDGIEVHVLTRRRRGLAAEEIRDGVHVHRLPAPGPKALASLVFTVAALLRLRSLRPDVVHAYSLFSPTTIGVLARWALGVPLVVKVLRGGEGGDVERLRAKPLARGRIALLRRSVDRIVTISREIDAELDALGIPEDRRLPLPNGVDTERFRPAAPGEREALRREHLGGLDGRVVVYTGRLVPEKCVDRLLAAWRGVRDRKRDATLVIVGEGPCEAELRERAGNGVLFVGGVDDVAPWLRAADAFVLPSLAEGLSNALLEAMSTGLPVIATAVGAAPEVVDDGRTGRLVRPGDDADLRAALLDVLDPTRTDDWHTTGLAARADVQARYALETTAARLAALYAELAEHAPVGSTARGCAPGVPSSREGAGS